MQKLQITLVPTDLIAAQDSKEVRQEIFDLCKESPDANYGAPYKCGFPGWHILDNKTGKALLAKVEKLIKKPAKSSNGNGIDIDSLNVAECFVMFQTLTAKPKKSAADKETMNALNERLSTIA